MQDDQQNNLQQGSLEAQAPVHEAPLSPQDVSLDAPTEPGGAAFSEAPNQPQEVMQPKKKQRLSLRIKSWFKRFNIYALVFFALLAFCIIGVFITNEIRSRNNTDTTTKTLSNDALDQLNNSDVKIGDPKQVLGIESNTIFAGKVLVRDSLEVAGSLKLGGELSLPGLTVAGTSNFDQIKGNDIAISNNAAIQGQVTIQKSLNVNGGGSFAGTLSAPQITVDTLQLNKDLRLSHHIDPTGATPRTTNGTALGSGGTASVSGTDTAGTVSINTGSSPPAGCFATISFTQSFTATPHIALTPANSAAASLNYYVSRNAASFSVCSASTPSAGQNYIFDFIAID